MPNASQSRGLPQLNFLGRFFIIYSLEKVISGVADVAVVTGKVAKTFNKYEIYGKSVWS